MNKVYTKWVLLGLVLIAVIAFFAFDVSQYLSLDYLQDQRSRLQEYAVNNPARSSLVYFITYVIVMGLALPAAALLTLAGGAIFGLWWGTLLVSFASTIGATFSFLASRYFLRDWVEKKFSGKFEAINKGIEKDGAMYLFTLRLMPLPPALINLSMGLTKLKTFTFYWASQLGMFLGTLIYVNAGTELGKLGEGDSIIKPGLIAAFVCLGLFPFIARKIVEVIQTRKLYRKYPKPEKFDTNLVVIGAGSGGLVSAYIAAQVKAKVTLIEKHKMGGDCLNTGCVPSKAILRSAKMAHYFSRAEEYGIKANIEEVNFEKVMQRVHNTIAAIEPHDSVERYEGLGVDCIQGEAEIISPYQVRVKDEVITTKNIIIATGGRPKMLDIEGVENIPVFNSDTIWTLKELPKKLLVIGAGPIGCELAQAFSRLGSEVTIVTNGKGMMMREDDDVRSLVEEQFEKEGINLITHCKAQRFNYENNSYSLSCEVNGEQQEIKFTHVLMAVGRIANVENIGLEALDIELTHRKTIEVDKFLRTKYPNIYAVGDVAGPYQFTHTASHQAWYASVNALFGRLKKFKVDYSVIPWATFTDPEVARVGLSEKEALRKGIDFEITRYGIDDLDRALADGEAKGFVKVITPKGSDKILGATIVGYHAGELLNEFIATMKRGGRLNDILGTIHIYPTLSEANKFAAGEWKKAHKPEWLMPWIEKFHSWGR